MNFLDLIRIIQQLEQHAEVNNRRIIDIGGMQNNFITILGINPNPFNDVKASGVEEGDTKKEAIPMAVLDLVLNALTKLERQLVNQTENIDHLNDGQRTIGKLLEENPTINPIANEDAFLKEKAYYQNNSNS